MGGLLIGLFNSDPFLKMWRNPDQHKDRLQTLMAAFYKVMPGSLSYIKKTSETPQGLDLDDLLPEFGKLPAIWERIDVIFKALDFAWCFGVTSGLDPPGTPGDVLKISSYKGQLEQEKTLKDHRLSQLTDWQLTWQTNRQNISQHMALRLFKLYTLHCSALYIVTITYSDSAE